MTKKPTGMLLAAAFCFMAFISAPGLAQDESPYDDVDIELNEDTAWMNVGVSLMRDPALPPENFIVNLTTAERYTTGCPPLKDMSYETEYKRDELKIRLLKLTVDQSEYPYYKCNSKPRDPQANIVLNKKDLVDKDIKKISVLNGPITKTYMLNLGDEKIELEVEDKCSTGGSSSSSPKNINEKKIQSCGSKDIKTIRMQSVNNVKNPLRLWFYPEGTMLLYTPAGKTDPKQIRDKIRSFAVSMGLTPLEDVYPAFQAPLIKNDYNYFVDKAGQQSGKMVDGAVLGNISIEKMAYGLHGDVPVSEEVPVYARRPGAYD